MIDNPQIGQQVMVYSFQVGGFTPAYITTLYPDQAAMVRLVTNASFIQRRLEHCYTEDEALVLSLQLAAGQWRPA